MSAPFSYYPPSDPSEKIKSTQVIFLGSLRGPLWTLC